MRKYRRRLPHIDLPGTPIFITWRLAGSLPKERTFLPEHLTSGAAFVAFDRLLDSARTGPTHLRLPEIATLVRGQLIEVSKNGCCALHAYAIMPNHVHVLWTPRIPLEVLMNRVKGASARLANKILGLTGQPFWQPEFFDRLVRSEEEFNRIRQYIELNPLKAALVAKAEDFPWSSAYREQRG